MSQLQTIEAIEKRLRSAADLLRATNSGLASGSERASHEHLFCQLPRQLG